MGEGGPGVPLLALGERVKVGLHRAWVVLQEAVLGFQRNDDLRQASSLAFYTTLALIPALLLLTATLSFAIGSSQAAMHKVSEFLGDVLPRSGEVVLREVAALARGKRGLGLVNLLVLLWSLTPLIAALRSILNTILKIQPRRAFWITKLVDLGAALAFITGLALVAGSGVLLRSLKGLIPALVVPAGLGTLLPFVFTVLLILGLFAILVRKVRFRHLLAGALVTALLWFLLRPAFTLFLTYNPGYGLTFGSFKSIFLVIIWIYYSQAVLLFGAEVVSALHRSETLMIRRILQGRRGLALLGRRQDVVRVTAGEVIFEEGAAGREMFHLLSGSVSIRKGAREVAVLPTGQFFGEMSFLLGASRSATAVALEDSECLVIHEENVEHLMREFPGIHRDMLTELARRLKATSERASGA